MNFAAISGILYYKYSTCDMYSHGVSGDLLASNVAKGEVNGIAISNYGSVIVTCGQTVSLIFNSRADTIGMSSLY